MASPMMGSPTGVQLDVKGGIITGGLGRPACQGMITMLPFQLGCFVMEPIPEVAPGQEGGSIPLQPGEIHDFYQPVGDKFDSEGNFVDPSVYGKRRVKITFKSDFLENDKEFLVNEKQMKNVIRLIKIANTTLEKMSVVFRSIRNLASRANVTAKNIRKRR